MHLVEDAQCVVDCSHINLEVLLDDHGRRAMVAERQAPIQWTLDPLAELSDRHRLVVELPSTNPADQSLQLSGQTKWSGSSGNSPH